MRLRLARACRSGARGFTLAELIVVVVLGMFFAAVFGEILGWSVFNLIPTLYTQGQLQMELTQASDVFKDDIALANGLPSTWGAFTRDTTTVGDNNAVIIIEVPALDASGQTLYGNSGLLVIDRMIYTFNTATRVAQRQVVAGAGSSRTNGTRNVANNVSRATVTWKNTEDPTAPGGADAVGPLEVTLVLQATRTVMGRQQTLSLTSRSVLRN